MNDFTLTRLLPLSRFDSTPFSGFDLTALDRWLNGVFPESGRMPAMAEMRALPRANVAETDKELVVSVELPGMEENDVNVRITGNQLVVSGERKQKKEEKDRHFHRLESTYGAFERRFELPEDVRKDPESVRATANKGILEIRIAKAEARPTVKIPVKAV
jgi:HSP20 family protein